MAWTSITNEISYLPVLLYIGAIFWTLGYDTIYGVQDISDDEIIGVKSTAIKFKNNLKFFVGCCYLISSIVILFVMINLEVNYSLIFLVFFTLTLLYQIKIFHVDSSESCFRAFKLNNISGLMIFLGFFFLTIFNI